MDDIIREKNTQFADFEKEFNYLKQTLSKQSKEKELLTKIFNVFKSESKEKEAKNIDKEISLEKKVKELDNIVCKMGNQCDLNPDSKETLILEEESQSKMLLKQTDPMILEKKVNIKLVNYAVLNQLSEDFDIVNIVVNSSVDMNTFVNVNSSVAMNDSVNYVEKCNKCLELEAELIKQHNMVEKDEYNKLLKRFSKLEQHCISLELAMQPNKEIFQKNNTSVNQTEPTFDQLFELNNLNAELQAKDTTIEKLKLIQELLGYVRDTCPDIHKPSEKLVAVTPINKKKTVSSMFDARHELCFLEFVSNMNASSKSKSVKKAKKKEEWKPTGKVFTKIGYNWRPTGRTFTLVGNACLLTRITTTNKVPFRKPISLEVVAQESVVTKVYTRRPNVTPPKTCRSGNVCPGELLHNTQR
ncbi:hypothetical protein Tco_1416836 [Tanacetum coccineum]